MENSNELFKKIEIREQNAKVLLKIVLSLLNEEQLEVLQKKLNDLGIEDVEDESESETKVEEEQTKSYIN